MKKHTRQESQKKAKEQKVQEETEYKHKNPNL